MTAIKMIPLGIACEMQAFEPDQFLRDPRDRIRYSNGILVSVELKTITGWRQPLGVQCPKGTILTPIAENVFGPDVNSELSNCVEIVESIMGFGPNVGWYSLGDLTAHINSACRRIRSWGETLDLCADDGHYLAFEVARKIAGGHTSVSALKNVIRDLGWFVFDPPTPRMVLETRQKEIKAGVGSPPIIGERDWLHYALWQIDLESRDVK